MKHTAVFSLCDTGLYRCLSRLGESSTRRSQVRIRRQRNGLCAEIEAQDLTALRSSVLGLMKHVAVYQKMGEIQ